MRCLWLALALLALSMSLRADEHAVILLYHHVSAETPASTSVTPAQFRAHLDYLADNDYNVLGLAHTMETLARGEELPPRSVVITFDDAYESIFTTAWPMLRERGWPFTVFVATEPVDRGFNGFMTWQQMGQMSLAEFGAHSLTHAHLLARDEGESEAARRDRVAAEIDESAARIHAALDTRVTSFAYPFGEYDESLVEMLAERDLYGLAQQSGAVGPTTSLQQLPRFPLAVSSASPDRFESILRTRPLPVAEPQIHARKLSPDQLPDHFHFRLEPGPYRAASLACYSASGEPLDITRIDSAYRVVLPAFRAGRNKINCTAPAADAPGSYHWYSHLWIVADPTGRWLQF